MKQKILTLFLALAASVGTMFAEVVKIGDLYYDLDVVYKNASVVPNPNGKYSGDIIIPPTVEDNNSIVYNVINILEGAFMDCTDLTGVTIPNSVTTIFGLAFQNCTSLTNIIIPEGVTYISNQVFFNCSGLTSVTLPKSLTVIGQLAFSNCKSLTDIIIPEGVTELYHSTFAQCSALTSVTIPSSVTHIMDYAFFGCSNLTNITCQAVVPPTCGEQVFGNVPKTIPVYVPKGSVAAYKAAGQWADFGDNIQVKIDTKQMTPGIAHLSWDKNNNQWGITAYDNGDNPQFVFTFSKDGDKGTLPVSMTLSDNTDDICAFADINDGSFGGTIKDAAITITYDGNGYQYDNVGKRHYVMAKISGEVSNAYHKLIVNEPADYIKVFVPSPEEIYAVWDEPNTTLTLYYNDQRIAQNGETDWSSYASTATTVVLDASMQDARPTSTAKWFFTFSKMTAIQNLEYLNTSEVTEMSAMFLGCSALTALDLSKFNTENVTNMNGMFYACSSLTSLDLSNFNTAKVEDMSYMFRACRSLTSLDVSSFNTANVTNMNYMFYYCYLLTSLDLSNFNTAKVTGMSGMFEGCESLKTIYCDDTWNPSSSDNMFYNCTALVGGKGTVYDANHFDKTYARPDGLGDQPGYFTKKNEGKCGENVYWVLKDGVLTISGTGPMYDFENYFTVPWDSEYTSIISVVVEDGVTSIGDWAFAYTNSLKSVTLPNSITTIGIAAFMSTNLTSVAIPNSVTTIRAGAFRYCTNLSSITLPNTIKSIANMTFDMCISLTSVTIPGSVENLGNQVFSGCTALTEITCEATTPPTCGTNVFEGVTNTIPVYVPAESVDAYRTADGWNYFENIQAKGAAPKEIYAALSGSTMTIYYDDQKASRTGVLEEWNVDQGSENVPAAKRNLITTAVINPSMKKIHPTSNYFWFGNLVKMTNIEGMENLNTSEVVTMLAMFSNCISLTDLDLSSFNTAKVKDMSYMFYNCSSLTSLDISSFNTANVESMYNMFYSCYSLKTIYCDDDWSTRSVEDDEMFFGCTSLVGGNGTEYDAGKVDKSYARLDGLGDQPGYFTAKSAPITPEEQKEIDAVIDLINAIGSPITLSSEAAITAARSAYDALTAAQQVLVTNYSVLTDAEQAYTKLKEVEIAKEQLKNIISEANQLKAVALIYAPSVVTALNDLVADAQSMIDDPSVTVDQVNTKAATLTGDLHTIAVNLLDQAKEQLKQSIIALFLPGDYPSWYDAVITPALNQVDGVTWDFNKSVNENIVFFQATGTQIYNDTKSALEALRASDTRSIVTACAFTGFEHAIHSDMTWNMAALTDLVNAINASVASEPYRLDVEMSSLGKWDPINATLVVLDPYAEEKLTAGDYQFVTAVRIDGEDAKQYRLPKATEEALSVSVDATPWTVDLSGIVIDATYSYTYVTSPMFTISKSEDVELINEDQLKTQKIFRDGHIYILRGDHIFDIRGTMVK